MSKKVLLGMSGGVDSSAAALLLLNAGYEVVGATMRLHSCASPDDINDARLVCRKLGIEHKVLDFTQIFEENVVSPFAQMYKKGLTPNPCVICNPRIKFGAFLRYAISNGCDFIATGHYAVSEQNKEGRFLIKKSPSDKDQSYFLYRLKQEQLSRALFPVGRYTKPEIRAAARQAGLPVAKKRDSQEICFINDNDYAGFLERRAGAKAQPGDFLDTKGNIIGRHSGVIRYTIGQRKGLGMSFGKPVYVTEINAGRNTVTLGDEKDLYFSTLTAENLNFIPFDKLEHEMEIEAKIRFSAKPAAARLIPAGGGAARVEFASAQRAVTPGQAVVFYCGDTLIGGGTISSRRPL